MKKVISYVGEFLLHKLTKLFGFAILGTIVAIVGLAAQWGLRQLGSSPAEAKTRVAEATNAVGPWLMFGLMVMGGYLMIKQELKRKEHLRGSKPPPLPSPSMHSPNEVPDRPHHTSTPLTTPVVQHPKDIFKVTEL